ncbi:response regulator transcription factor [Candidatus Woesebacteria bacterium]|nr:response regulator transcription factor [Candidatus Woesebacteria bacterium]
MRILIVEDEYKIANSIRRGLEQETFAVDVAFDGESGYDLASTENYDVIILDLMLPKIDGLTICKNLRAENIHTPILILTARDSVNEKVEGLNSGADDYLPKPFSFTELLARVRALSRRPKQTLDSVLQTKDLTLNTKNLEVKRGKILIELSKTELSLLEYLLRNKGKVVTKDQIIEHVWDYDSDVLPNTVEVYIGYLRGKLEKPFKGKSKIIETVRGFGYKVSE